MRTSHREIVREETGRRLESMLHRFSEVREVFPWLRPGLSHAALRRTVNRLRTGAIHSIDPRIPSDVLADLLENSIAQDTLIRSVRTEMEELRELERRLGRRTR
jgi:hypothetical protein